MKKITITNCLNNEEWLLIENINDLFSYTITLKNKVEYQTKRLILSQASVDRWDHMLTNNSEGAIFSASIIKATHFGGSPLKELDLLFSDKIKNMLQELKKGKILLVNSVGGYCTIKNDDIINVEKEEVLPIEVKTYQVKQGTKYINIENDDKLEKDVEQYLSKRDPNFSYVLNLYTFNQEELLAVFNNFKSQGGEILYVYTTGIDLSQMKLYIEVAILAGIKKIELKIKNGINEQHTKILNSFSQKEIDFVIL